MPALLTRMSTLPYLATVSATPFSTWASSMTFMATAKASLPLAWISLAVALGGIEVEIGDDGDAAFGGEAECDLLADAARRTGDDGNSSFEAGHANAPCTREIHFAR